MNKDVILIDKNVLLHELEEVESSSIAAARIIQAREQYTAESITFASLSVVRDVINDAPAIDPVKHGKWIFDLSDVDWTYGPYVCSECHARNGDFIGGGLNKRTNYCPNCGAKMDADEQEATK